MSSKIQILDPALELLATINAASSALRTEKINSDNTLDFTFRIKNAASAYINDTNVISLNNDYFDIAAYKKEQQSDGILMVSVECEHVSYRLNDPDYDLEFFTQTGTPTAILTEILDTTGFTVGTVDYTDAVTYSAQEKKSRRALLMEFVAYLGGEVQFDGFEVSILEQRGSTTPTALRTGKDITVISKSVNKRKSDSLGNPVVSYACGLLKIIDLELGDVVTLDYDTLDIDVSLRIVSISYDPYNPNNVSIEVGNYINALEDDIYRIETSTLTKGKTYYGARISPENGFESIRSDKMARGVFNAELFALQAGDGSGSNWTNKLYFDPVAGKYIFDGTLSADTIEALEAEFDVTVSNTVITNNLYAARGYIAELTVDQLDTSDKVAKYLVEDTSDVNYIKVYDQNIEFITASTDGLTTTQAEDRNGNPLYWINAEMAATTTDVTDYPVTIYEYDELIKMRFKFEEIDEVYTPVLTLGAGTGVEDRGKAFFYKNTDGLLLKYITSDGNSLELALTDNGIEQIGNTGAIGLRNIAISETAPENPQINDLWIQIYG